MCVSHLYVYVKGLFKNKCKSMFDAKRETDTRNVKLLEVYFWSPMLGTEHRDIYINIE